jgi:hypothetical protein
MEMQVFWVLVGPLVFTVVSYSVGNRTPENRVELAAYTCVQSHSCEHT